MGKINAFEKFPNFTVQTLNSDSVTFQELTGGKKTLVMVLRYFGCTICRLDIHNLNARYNEFVEKDLNVVVVMQSKKEIVEKDLNGGSLPFEFVCDTAQEIYKTLEILPAESMKGLVGDKLAEMKEKVKDATEKGYAHGEYEGVEEQLPAFFVVDGELNTLEAHYAKNLMDMPTVDEMLAK